jgi:hypothetical protein
MTATLLGGATALGVMSPLAAQALTVTLTVGGNNYDVTTLETSYSASSAILQSQPWWQNTALADALAGALGTQLGTPNTGGSPYFANAVSGTPPFELVNSIFFIDFIGVIFSNDSVGNLLTFAVLDQPAPVNPVPGPLPLFGAAAAFGMSRRLRQRIRRAF